MDSGRKYNDDGAGYRRPDPTRRSIVLLFTVGSCLLIVPLAIVLIGSPLCRADSICSSNQDYRVEISTFPYVMIGGGILIGYNMKRIADSMKFDNSENGESEDGDPGDATLQR